MRRCVLTNGRWIGRSLDGRYEISELIGEGGTACVYRAVQQPIGREVAIKVLRATSTPAAAARFLREVQIVSRLNHPSIVTVHDAGTTPEGEVYLVMELANGRLLAEILEERRRVTLDRAVRLFGQMCGAVHAAHAAGVIHRDLKPGNMTVLPGPTPSSELLKVLDFGIAKAVTGEGESVSKVGTLCGTPRYMSPEQVACRPIDARADIYALGTVLYEMLCGETPFMSKDVLALLRQQVKDAPPPLARHRPDLPPALDAAILKALHKRPEERWGSAWEFYLAVEASARTSEQQSVVSRLLAAPAPPGPRGDRTLTPEVTAAPVAEDTELPRLRRQAEASPPGPKRGRALSRVASALAAHEAWDEAATAATEALDHLLGEVHDRARVEELLATIQRGQGRLAETQEWLSRARASYRAAGDPGREGRVAASEGKLAYARGDAAHAEAEFQAAVALFREGGHRREIVETLRRLAVLAERDGRLEDAEQSLGEALEVVYDLEDAAEAGHCYDHMAAIVVKAGRPEDARHWHQEAAGAHEQAKDWRAAAASLGRLTALLLAAEDDAAVREVDRRAVPLLRRTGNNYALALTLRRLGDASAAEAHWADAVRCYEESDELFQRLGAVDVGNRAAEARYARAQLGVSPAAPTPARRPGR